MPTSAQLDALRDVAAGRPPARRDVLGRLVAARWVRARPRYRAGPGGALQVVDVEVELTARGQAVLDEQLVPAAHRAGRLF